MAEKRRDNRGRILKDGETQRPSGEYRYKYTDITGQRREVSSWKLVSTDKVPAGKRDCKALRDMEKEIQRDLQDGINGKAANEMTLNELFDRYAASHKVKETTRAWRDTCYRLYVREGIGRLKVSDIKYSMIRALYNDMAKRGLSIGTIAAVNSVLHPTFALAVKDDLIRKNPTNGILGEIRKAGSAKEPKKRHALTKQQQAALVDFVKQSYIFNRWSPLVTCLLGTGCRITEMLGLTWTDIDFKKNIISINHILQYTKNMNDDKCTFHISTPKTKDGVRVIPILPEVKTALLRIRKEQMQCGFPKAAVDGYSDFVFITSTGNPQSISGINQVLRRIVNAYNKQETEAAKEEKREAVLLPHISAHILRHTFATRICEEETNLKVVQEVMGHSDIRITMNIYNTATQDAKQEAFKNLQGKIKIS